MTLSNAKKKEMEVRNRSYSADYRVGPERLTEFDAVRAAAGPCQGLRVLDVGCGIGQMTSSSLRCVAVRQSWWDLTWRSRGSGASKLRPTHPYTWSRVMSADCRFGRVFDLVISCQVLEHMESPADRDNLLDQLSQVLVEDGRLVLTTYNWDAGRRMAGVPKEGFHETGIYYYCYESAEFAAALARHFAVNAGRGRHFPKNVSRPSSAGKA